MEKTNSGLVAYCEAQLGNPYWYGTYGQTASEKLYLGKKKQYPSRYRADDFPSQYGKRVHDCSGLVKGYLFSDTPQSAPKYDASYDWSANTTRAKSNAQPIASLPELPGALVFMEGHVGVYIGGGEVIEARGHSYGVVKTKLAKRAWLWWGKHPAVRYDTEVSVSLPLLQKGSKGAAVESAQVLLAYRGFHDAEGHPLSPDGSFGARTKEAVTAFQQKKSLPVDGKIDEKTWQALLVC